MDDTRFNIMSKPARLQLYLNSYGTDVPKAVSSSVDFCHFCNRAHVDIPVLEFKEEGTFNDAVVTEYRMCESCWTDVEEFERDIEGLNPRDGVFAKQTALSVKDRISNLARHYRFDNTVDYHYSNFPMEFAHYKHNCYGCKRLLVTPLSKNKKILLPVEPFRVPDYDTVSGDAVYLCPECSEEYTAVRKASEDLEDHGALSVFHNVLVDTCPRCHHEYLITSNEFAFRGANSNTQDHHVCPTCTMDQLLFSDHRMMDLIPFAAGEEFHRFHYVSCQHCTDSIPIDVTLDHDFLVQKHLIDNKRTCDNCRLDGKAPIFAIRRTDRIIKGYAADRNRIHIVVTKPISNKLLFSYYSKDSVYKIVLDIESNEQHPQLNFPF